MILLNTACLLQTQPLQAVINIEGNPLTMEVDTGAAVSIISDKTWNSILKLQKLLLQSTTAKLRTYTGHSIVALGELSVKVEYYGQNTSGSTRRWP